MQNDTAISNILDLIPQRPPMVMVDAFYGVEDGTSRSGLTVESGNIFCKGGVLREPGIVEHIAQSAAARAGYIFKMKNEPVPLGFIGSVDKLTIHRLPRVGNKLQTTISVMQEMGGLSLISAKTEDNEGPVAECRMKIFLKID
ncbi:MAG: hydroxymyristoyl-ACP dehydratase [Salinivirgaceae bacterium]|nr:hydroxymyristoyl-ACP dehydratase [Salinivirgaceae bacterium]